ncbi:MAG: DUF3309 family protein [Pirellulales bacterium]
MRLLLILFLALLLVVLLPTWPYSEPWGLGYVPSGVVGLIVAIVLIMGALSARAGPP